MGGKNNVKGNEQDAHMSMASIFGLSYMNKLYQAQIDAKTSSDSNSNVFNDDDVSDDEDTALLNSEDQERMDFVTGLPNESLVAYFTCYDEKLRSELYGEYPAQAKHLQRRRSTPSLGESRVPSSRSCREFIRLTRQVEEVKLTNSNEKKSDKVKKEECKELLCKYEQFSRRWREGAKYL